MLFYEPLFLFVFLPGTFAIYLRLRRSAQSRRWTLLAASVLFYGWGEPAFVPVVFASALLDHGLSRRVARRSRWALVLGLTANLALLMYYKYLFFLASNLFAILGMVGISTPAAPHVLLPIGVSFVVFEKITYLVDIWRGQSRPAPRISYYLTYVFFFPKLLAGPIIKYHEIEAQFRDPPPLREGLILDGFARFMLGVIKKLLIADIVGPASDGIFALTNGQLGFGTAWIGVVLFTIQIYIDFSAYSDMAIGLARMFGFRLNENFNRPYISCSITEFWRRWHISLSSWIREYLYIPLGGNRVAPWRRMANLWTCFLASGLWHGAAWTYVLWGGYNGLFLVLDRLFLLRLLDRMPRVVANAATMVVMVGWTIFRVNSLPQLMQFATAMTHPALVGVRFQWELAVAAATTAGLLVSLAPRIDGVDAAAAWFLARRPGRLMVELIGVVLFAVAVDKAVTDPFRPFLYFRF